jgi:hypothetical protein
MLPWNSIGWCLCSFVSTPDPIGNKYYLGPAPLKDMARWATALLFLFYYWWIHCLILVLTCYYVCNIRQIATANGPNGYNRDYLFSMEKALSNIRKSAFFYSFLIRLSHEQFFILTHLFQLLISNMVLPASSPYSICRVIMEIYINQ